MSYRPKIKQDDETTIDLPIDAETLNGKTAEQWLSEYVDIASDQTITGMKAFSTSVWASISWIGLINDADAPAWQFNPAGLYFYPDRSQVLENKLIAYNSTSGLFVLGTNFNYTYSIPDDDSSTAIATTEWVTTKINTALSSISDITNIVNNTTKIAETNFGGFSAGENSSATTGGGAVGSDASTLSGGAVGSGANSTTGGAVGLGAYTTTGFAGGYMAKASANGAVQLGEGVNQDANTLQFRGYKIVDSNGNVPAERIASAVSNPNILINSDFKINQRNQSSWSFRNTEHAYTVDRWYGECAGGTSSDLLTVTYQSSNGTIQLSSRATNGSNVLAQPIEEGLLTNGETYTMSGRIDGAYVKKTFVLSNSNISVGVSDSAQVQIGIRPCNLSGADWEFYIILYGSVSTTISEVKLEKGDTATKYIAPDFTTEFLKCCRFYQAFEGTTQAYGSTSASANTAYMQYPLKTVMRERPTITVGSGTVRGSDNYEGSINSVTVASYYPDQNNSIYINVNFNSSGFTTLRAAVATFSGIWFDAEI